LHNTHPTIPNALFTSATACTATVSDRAPHGLALVGWLLVLCLLLASGPADLAAQGVPVSVGRNPLSLFGITPPEPSLNLAGSPIFENRREFLRTRVDLVDAEGGAMVLYTELGGERFGTPVFLSLSEFAAAKYGMDAAAVSQKALGKKATGRLEEGGGLMNFKIPVRVPRGLSMITGEGTTNIKITGSRRIDLSGLSRSTAGQAQTARARAGEGFTINFEQESQLNVTGTIGDRITIDLQQDSRGQVDLGESLKLRYNGDEDQIIQEIEAGSTSLSLSGTRLIGFSSPNRGGLFGIRAKGSVGGVDLTVVTTQDKGASNRKTFQGQSEEIANDIRDYEYVEDQYFFLDDRYRRAFPDQPANLDLVDINSVKVFVNDYNDLNDIEQRAFPAVAYTVYGNDGRPDVEASTALATTGGLTEGSFHELPREDFLVDAKGYLIMSRQRISPSWALAVAYQTSDRRSFGDVGFIHNPSDPNSKGVFKLIKARQQRADYETWPLAWRNVYTLGGRGIDPEGFELEIYKDLPGQEPVDNQNGKLYLQVFGLDTHTNGASESSPPDNIIDIRGGAELPGLNLALGHLVFFDLEPFGAKGVGADDLDDASRVPGIYDTHDRRVRAEKTKYFMRVRSKSRATEYNLGFGIIDNSEEVVLNNRRLSKGKDYSIDYQFGSIRFVGDAADQVADPSSNLVINYGQKGLFGLGGGQKSLMGFRAERPFKDNVSLIGMTVLYSSQSAVSQRVRVGEEPARTLIWDANARFRLKPRLLTDLVNRLPFVTTDAPSSLNIDAEVAQSLPNPNTKNVAYVDDFEGAESRLGLSIFKVAWNQASTPIRDAAKITEPKGRLTWYNPIERDRVSIYDIQPGREDIPAEQSIADILTLRFDPARTNGFPRTTSNSGGGFPQASWAGMMSYLGGYDLSRSKFIEIWVKGNAGKLHVDLGEITERVDLPLDHPGDPLGFDELRNEDTPLPGFPTGDDVATPGEDIGLDGLTDAQEDSVFRLIFPTFGSPPDDPSQDNFVDVQEDVSEEEQRYPPGVNGTEGNNPERDSRPDSEDLNRNGILDTRNSFVRYSVDLATDRGLDPATGHYEGQSLLVVGTRSDPSDNPWRLVRIPLRGQKAPRTTEGTPDTTFASVVDYARVWVEHDKPARIQFYTIDVVGSNWQEDPPPPNYRSGDFKVSTIGTDNEVYESPPGIEQEIDPTTGARQLERSLTLRFEDLYPGDRISASQTFLQGANYTQYGTMTMFVHGGNPADLSSVANFPAAEDSLAGRKSPIELFVRFAPIGGDTLNYYEYSKPIYRGWSPEVNNVEIDLELMSQLKGQLLDLRSANQASSDSVTISLVRGDLQARFDSPGNAIEVQVDEGTYFVRGNPALSNIKSFAIGVVNRGDLILQGENEIWLDELRVDDIRKRSAISMLMNVQAVLADLGNLSINLERRSGDFQDLQGKASGKSTGLLSLDGQMNLNKFLPEAWNTLVPVRFSYNRNTSVPRIRTGSDIVLTPEQQKNESDTRSGARVNISFRKRQAREDPKFIARIFFDKISASLNYSTDSSTGGAITRRRANESQNLNGNFSYDLSWTQRKGLKLFTWVPLYKPLKGLEFYFQPSNLRYNVTFNRNKRDQRSFSAVGDSSLITTGNETFTLSEVYKAKVAPFTSLTLDYDLSINRDLRNAFSPGQLQFGRETNRNQTVALNYTPRLSRWFNVSFQLSGRYRESLETGGQRTDLGNVRRGLTAGNTNDARIRGSINLPAMFQPMARSGKGLSVKKLIGKVGATFQTLQASASRNTSHNLYGLQSRPSLKFQLGLTDTTKVEIFETFGVTRVNSENIKDNLSLSSGVRLPAGFNTGIAATYQNSKTFGNSDTEEERIEFPNVNASWHGLERLPVFRWLFTSSSINMNYRKGYTKRGEGSLDDLSLTSDSEETAYNPLLQWNARWKGQLSTTLRTTVSSSDDLRYQRNVASDTATVVPTLQERLIGTTLNETSGFTASVKYALSSRFFKKLQGNLDLDLSFGKNGSLQKEIPRTVAATDTVEAVIRRNEDSWNASLAAQYQFSSKFTGGTRLRRESRTDVLRDLTNNIWEFRLWGEIRFN
jgi:hypothetical protein